MIYVDQLQPWPTPIRCFKAGACHLVADTLDELHAIAKRLGLRRDWFQDGRNLPHYDLTAGKRVAAVGMGARELSRAEMGARMKSARSKIDGIPLTEK